MVKSIECDDITELSPVLNSFFKPIYEKFENSDTVIKVIEISLSFFDGMSEHPSLMVSVSYETVYSVLDTMPKTDEEIFEIFKNYVDSPADPEDEEEVGLTQQQLAELRDPNGIRFLSVSSEEVKELLQEFRSALQETPAEVIQEIADEALLTLEELHHFSKNCRIDLKVDVLYADKLNLAQVKSASFAQTIVSNQIARPA
jgi:DNA-directed RNA polymerase subunit F